MFISIIKLTIIICDITITITARNSQN